MQSRQGSTPGASHADASTALQCSKKPQSEDAGWNARLQKQGLARQSLADHHDEEVPLLLDELLSLEELDPPELLPEPAELPEALRASALAPATRTSWLVSGCVRW